jgi:hypothetical protein
MKRISIVLVLLLVLVNRTFAQYLVTNDLQSPFTLFYWTNNGTTNVFSLSSNTPAMSNYVVSITTNGHAGLGLQPTNGTFYLLTAFTNMPFGTNSVGGLFTNALTALQPALETVPQWQSILKSYFINGAVPTEQNYWELIDTTFYYINQTYLNSLFSANNAVIAATRSANVFATAIFTVTNVGNNINLGGMIGVETNGFSSTLFGGYSGGAGNGGFRMTNYFQNTLTNFAYVVVRDTPASFGINPPGETVMTTNDFNNFSYGMTSNYFWMVGTSTANPTRYINLVCLFYQ